MISTSRFFLLVSMLLSMFVISGCSPDVGTKEWCVSLSEKPKGDWMLNETKDYTKHCLFR